MGTIGVTWNPDFTTVRIHKLHIIRGSQIIDVLTTGQTFTVLRRETNLDGAALDGTLTAEIQPGDLQVGDIIDFSYTKCNRDPVFKGLSEWRVAASNQLPITRLRLRALWPRNLAIHWQSSPAIAGIRQISSDGVSSVTYAADNAQPLPQANDAPARYIHVRRIDFTQFSSWAALSKHFAPLYAKANSLPRQSSLQETIASIKMAYAKPQDRASAALSLVQDQVRYVFLGMNDGGLVPAAATLTWTRRFGDCKGKTVLLLALLHGLGIEAEPVLVSTSGGDGLDTMLPRVSDFDHVIVRASIYGVTYWLDGTRTGDSHIADIAVPSFHWGLPLTSGGADLVPIATQPLSKPSVIEALRIDASNGSSSSKPFHAEMTLRGDAASRLRMQISNAPQSAVNQGLRNLWTQRYSFVDIKSVSAVFDSAAGVEQINMDGTAPLQMTGRFIRTQNLTLGVGRVSNFDRAPWPDHDAPFAVPFPSYVRSTETVVLPNGGAGYTVLGENLDRIEGGVEYKRSAKIDHGSFVGEMTERSLTPEFPAAEAQGITKALRDLREAAVYIQLPDRYASAEQDLLAMRGQRLITVDQYLHRGNLLLDYGHFDEALSDFSAALALDPHSATALADRGLTYAWKDDDKRAAVDLDAASAADPHNFVLSNARGLLAYNAGHEREAIAAFTETLRTEPSDVFALTRRASAYVQVGDDDRAFSDTKTLMRVDPGYSFSNIVRAGIFRRHGLPEQAAAEARAITTTNPDNVAAHIAAARIYGDLHHAAEAMHEFDKALAIKRNAATYLARARARDITDTVGRRADIEAALSLDPHDKSALIALAKLQSEARNHSAAAATLSTALAIHPKDSELLNLRGIEYIKSNQPGLANQDFIAAKVSATASDDNNLCWFKAMAGVVPDAALEDCRSALTSRPGNTTYLDSQGFVMLRLAHYKDAISTFSKVIQYRPTMPTSLFGRSIGERRLGDAKAADMDLAEARKSNPDIDQRFSGLGLEP